MRGRGECSSNHSHRQCLPHMCLLQATRMYGALADQNESFRLQKKIRTFAPFPGSRTGSDYGEKVSLHLKFNENFEKKVIIHGDFSLSRNTRSYIFFSN